jgi:glucose/arabinose dehydrogenase
MRMLATAFVLLIGCLPCAAQQATAQTPAGREADPAKLPEQEIGRQFSIKLENLPAPKVTTVASSRSFAIPYAGQAPRVPDSFKVNLFAGGLSHPRDVIVAEQRMGYLTLLRDGDGDGRAEWIQRHAEGFNAPYGLAWRDDNILVADQDGIWSVPHRLGNLRPGPARVERLSDVPPEKRKPSPSLVGEAMITKKGVFGIVQGHQNRHLAIDPRSGGLFVGVGSSGNIGIEPEVKASIQRFDADGSNQTTFASGLRNPTALAFHPDTGDLYTVVQERDGLGDGLVPDFLTKVTKDGFYGWPYAYVGTHPQPGFAEMNPEKVKATVAPDLLFEAHSSAMDLVFYQADQFPAEYRGNLFVVLRGSWNRSEPTGYKIVRIRFKDGRPEASYENFMTGFWVSGMERAEVWGRPTALAVMRDGSLLVADDTGGTIWRVTYDRK